MRTHPYLRAYMAGVTFPTIALLLALTAFVTARYGLGVDIPVERLLVFPLAIVPSLWGVWNMLHLGLQPRLRISLGLHGALLPLLFVPGGVLLARSLGLDVPLATAALFAPIGMVGYYLIWKYAVGFLNAEIGIG